MAWRPTKYVMEGELDNTELGKVTGWIKFLGKRSKIKFDLRGDFHRDIRGAKIRFVNNTEGVYKVEAKKYMEAFAQNQTGDTGDITSGLPTGKNDIGENTYDYGKSPYIEWYGDDNGRVVIEMDKVEIVGTPIPVIESDPIDRQKQNNLMMGFMSGICQGLNNKK